MDEEFSPFGGWLIPIAVGLLISPFLLLYQLYALIVSSPGGWWNPLIRYRLLSYSALFVGTIFLAVIFFMEKKSFPRYMIIALVARLVLVVIDFQLLPSIATPQVLRDEDADVSTLLLSVFACLVWIPYLLRSRRVKANFVK